MSTVTEKWKHNSIEIKFGSLSLAKALGDGLSGVGLGLALIVIGRENVIGQCKNNFIGHVNKGQDLGTVLRCCFLVFLLKILSYRFFFS